MELSKEFITGLMKELEFPEDAQSYLGQIAELFEVKVEYLNELKIIIKRFYDENYSKFEEDILSMLDNLAQRLDINKYTMHLMFFMYCAQELKIRYNKSGISEDVFWNSMLDLRCKLMECKEVHDVWGTFVAFWFPGFYKLQRFGLGRFQYEYYQFDREDYTINGYTIRKGDRVFNMHIPSSGAMPREARVDSYRKAYEFFKDELNGKPIVFVCNSWLLYSENEKILPQTSNIVDFMHDFNIIESRESDEFTAAWRIFGKDYKNPVDKLPLKTSVQRAFAEWLKVGGKTGRGYGVISFDGNNII